MDTGSRTVESMRIALVTINDDGRATAAELRRVFPRADHLSPEAGTTLSDLVARSIGHYEGFVFCMATGIVVRVIAEHLTDKYHDPAVVVMDNARRYAISLLSGHEGGANELCLEVARATGAEPVITTATEAKKRVVVGIGCRKNVEAGRIVTAITATLTRLGIDLNEVRSVASIDIKRFETGLVEGCGRLGLPLRFVANERVARFRSDGVGSGAAKRHLGLEGVCEPCALLTCRNGKLVQTKVVIEGVTVAVAVEQSPSSVSDQGASST